MTNEQVLQLLPEIELIQDPELRRKSLACWQEALESGGWEEKGVRSCPLGVGLVDDTCPERSIDHCRHVAQVCQAVWDEAGGWMQALGPLDHDVLLCSAVLHDVGKFLEYDVRDGQACHSENGRMFRHVISGAYLAKKHGLPDEIVSNILSHSDAQSPEGGRLHVTPELIFLKQVDFLCFSMAQIHYPYHS